MKILLTVLCCIYLNVARTQESFHLIKFMPPVNWSVQQADAFRQYMFFDSLTNNYCVITVYPAMNSSGNLETDFSQEWKARVLGLGIAFGNPKTVKGTLSSQINYMEGGKVVFFNNGKGAPFIKLMVINSRNRRQSIAFLSGAKKTLDVFKPILQDFMSSIQKNDNTDVAYNNTGVAQTNDGTMNTNAYTETAPSNNGVFYCGMQAGTGGYNAGNSIRYLYLGQGNNFRWGYLQEGYYNYNPETEKTKSPEFSGTYTNVSNKIVLNFYSSQTMEFSVNKNKDLESIFNGNVQFQLTKFPQLNDFTFEGSYIKADLLQSLWPNGRQPTARMFKNGRFEDEGLLSMGEAIDPSLPLDEWKRRTTENQIPGNGTYKIIDNSILLNYDDGRRKQLVFYVFEKDIKKSSPDLIVIAGQSFTLTK